MKHRFLFMALPFILATASAFITKPSGKNLKFNVTGFSSNCSESKSVNCQSTVVHAVCTFDFGTGPVNLYIKDANQNCTIPLYLPQ